MVEVKNLDDIVRSVTYFDGDKASGIGIGQYLLALFIGIMGGMVPQLMRPEFLKQAQKPRSLHALLVMVILTHTLSSNAFPTLVQQLTAVLVVYLWFVMLIKTDVRYISAVLLLLVVALLMYRFRSSASATPMTPEAVATYKKIEMYIYLATLILSIVAVFMSMPPKRGIMDLPGWLFGDIITNQANSWTDRSSVTATTGSQFGFSSTTDQ